MGVACPHYKPLVHVTLYLLTLQVSVDDSILVKEDYPVSDLFGVVTDDILTKVAEIMEQLVQTPTCIT